MKFCSKCGKELAEGARFCRACGTAIAQRPMVKAVAAGAGSTVPSSVRNEIHFEPAQNQPSSIQQPELMEEEELPPPPPDEGLSFSWVRDGKGRVRPAENVQPTPSQVAKEQPLPDKVSEFPASGNLPPAPIQWKFRERTSAWAEAAATRLAKTNLWKKYPALTLPANRMLQGALLHRTVYRETAQHPNLNKEAGYVIAVLIATGFVGVLLTGGLTGLFSRFSIGALWRIALLRLVGWTTALFAIQFASKKLQQVRVDLPVTTWFRALVYAQAPLILAIFPGLGSLAGLWAFVATAAAVHDLTGRDTKMAVILVLIGSVASALATYLVTSLLF